MMGDSKPQRGLFYSLSLETFASEDHPLRRILPLILAEAVGANHGHVHQRCVVSSLLGVSEMLQ